MEKLIALLGTLYPQQSSTSGSVEILISSDNFAASLGVKRNQLVRAAKGRYIVNLDDDDSVSDQFIERVISAVRDSDGVSNPPDVIAYNSIATINHGNPFLVTTSISDNYLKTAKEDIEQARIVDGKWISITRPPWHWCCWRRELAAQFQFPDGTVDEDWYWLRQILPAVKEAVHLKKALHFYDYNNDQSLSNRGAPTT